MLTPVLVVGGWVVVYRLQALQARRKHLREMAEKTREAVVQLLELAIKFHTTKFDSQQKLAIVLALTHIEKRYELFPHIAVGKNECMPSAVDPALVTINPAFLVELRQAITLDHFDGDEEPLSQGAEQVQRISAAALGLIGEIDRVIVSALD